MLLDLPYFHLHIVLGQERSKEHSLYVKISLAINPNSVSNSDPVKNMNISTKRHANPSTVFRGHHQVGMNVYL